MSKFWILIVHIFALIISSTSNFIDVQLSTTEIEYLSERLQYEEHMSSDDAINTIIELEHFYTLTKNNPNDVFSPSTMVDKAWHQHILHTQMYNMFSRKHFDREVFHHVPVWSGNTEEIKQISSIDGEFSSDITFNRLVSMFGSNNVNSTIWMVIE